LNAQGEEGGEPGQPLRRWPLEWTPEHVQRHWDWHAQNPDLEHTYFSLRLGDDLLAHVGRRIPLRGTLLDLGCGPGHLLEKALGRGLRVTGVDASPRSIARVVERLGGRPGFQGAQAGPASAVPLPDACADIVTVVETVEHLDDAQLAGVLREAGRLLRPGGHVVVTTPNEERLGELTVTCPACGCAFHQFQHVRSFSAATLRALVEGHGFSTRWCQAVLLSFLPTWMRPFHRLVYRRVKGRPPHLVYVGARL
jgi:SAM-dependent methyltransferase